MELGRINNNENFLVRSKGENSVVLSGIQYKKRVPLIIQKVLLRNFY